MRSHGRRVSRVSLRPSAASGLPLSSLSGVVPSRPTSAAGTAGLGRPRSESSAARSLWNSQGAWLLSARSAPVEASVGRAGKPRALVAALAERLVWLFPWASSRCHWYAAASVVASRESRGRLPSRCRIRLGRSGGWPSRRRMWRTWGNSESPAAMRRLPIVESKASVGNGGCGLSLAAEGASRFRMYCTWPNR